MPQVQDIDHSTEAGKDTVSVSGEQVSWLVVGLVVVYRSCNHPVFLPVDRRGGKFERHDVPVYNVSKTDNVIVETESTAGGECVPGTQYPVRRPNIK